MKQQNLGIITEYNPFHNGHLYNLLEGKKITNSSNVIVVMSGNFVQRGLPAILDKYKRCEMALKSGADLCIEMPTHFALEGAENFSKCGITLLEKSNMVQNIVFGSENGNIKELESVATILLEEPTLFKSKLSSYLKEGYSYPKSIDLSLEYFGFKNIFTANNTLGIQYIKSLLEINSKIKAYTIKREGSNYHDTSINENNSYLGASASAIREIIYEKKDTSIIKKHMPTNIINEFLKDINVNYTLLDNFSNLLHYKLSTTSTEELRKYNHISEGIENRIFESSNEHFLISDIVANCVTKRYTKSKVQRCILSIILGIEKEKMNEYKKNELAQYIRVLGYRKEKEFLVKDLVKSSTLPVVMNVNRSFLPPLAKEMLEEEKVFSNIYNLCFNVPSSEKYTERQSRPIIY